MPEKVPDSFIQRSNDKTGKTGGGLKYKLAINKQKEAGSMAIYNVASDSANTGVRAFLTKVGELYLGRSFNTGSGQGKKDWTRIKESVFKNCCAYCGANKIQLGMEHLVMFNRSECGLHHPGNVVPCCRECNKRSRDENKEYVDWETHFKNVNSSNSILKNEYQERLDRIRNHIIREDYPDLTLDEKTAIRILAQSLYKAIRAESEKVLGHTFIKMSK